MFNYLAITSFTQKPRRHGKSHSCLALVASLGTNSLWAANAVTEGSNSSVWDWVIGAIVLAATVSSSVLCLAAYRNWEHRGWQCASLFPLALLALLLAMIGASQFGGTNSHNFWPLEVFAWSMFNMIYMVGIMTTKRIFEKADAIQD